MTTLNDETLKRRTQTRLQNPFHQSSCLWSNNRWTNTDRHSTLLHFSKWKIALQLPLDHTTRRVEDRNKLNIVCVAAFVDTYNLWSSRRQPSMIEPNIIVDWTPFINSLMRFWPTFIQKSLHVHENIRERSQLLPVFEQLS